jgi:AcrR family transcriptional regulator
MDRPTGLRERKKRATRDALADAALRLCVEHGVEQVTVEQVATDAGVSLRTFFNYFSSKEEAVVAGDVATAAAFVTAFAKRPLDEPVIEALRRALLETVADHLDRARAAQLQALRRTPSLLPHQIAAYAAQERGLAGAVAGPGRRRTRHRPVPADARRRRDGHRAGDRRLVARRSRPARADRPDRGHDRQAGRRLRGALTTTVHAVDLLWRCRQPQFREPDGRHAARRTARVLQQRTCRARTPTPRTGHDHRARCWTTPAHTPHTEAQHPVGAATTPPTRHARQPRSPDRNRSRKVAPDQAPVAQPAEATDSKPVQCAFESHRGHPHPPALSRPFTCKDALDNDHGLSGSVRLGPAESG